MWNYYFLPINVRYILSYVGKDVRCLTINLGVGPLTTVHPRCSKEWYKGIDQSAYFLTSFKDWIKLSFASWYQWPIKMLLGLQINPYLISYYHFLSILNPLWIGVSVMLLLKLISSYMLSIHSVAFKENHFLIMLD